MPTENCINCPFKQYIGKKDLKVFVNGKYVDETKYKEVPYAGKSTADFVVVGESPGSYECYKVSPFVGDTGNMIKSILRVNDIDTQTQVIFSNACRCMIPKSTNFKETTSNINKALELCKPTLIRALKNIKPKFILLLGNFALKQLTKKSGITKHRGIPIYNEDFQCWVMPTFHPAFCMRDPSKTPYFEADVKKAIEIYRDGYDDAMRDKVVEEKYQDVESIDFLLNQKNLFTAFDTETQGLDWTNPNSIVLSYSISWEVGSGVNVYLHYESDESNYDFVIQWPRNDQQREAVYIKKAPNFDKKVSELKELFRREDIKKTMMNGNFDINRLYNLGITEINGYTCDIKTLVHCLDPDGYKNMSLSDIQRVFLPERKDHKLSFKDNVDMNDMLAAQKENPRRHTVYSCGDTDATLEAANTLKKEIKKDKRLLNYYVHMVHPIEKDVLFEIHRNGINFDSNGVRLAQFEVKQLIAAETHKCLDVVPTIVRKKHIGRERFQRDDFTRDILFSKDGFNLKPADDLVAKTDSGNNSVGRKALNLLIEKLEPDHPAFTFLSGYLALKPFLKLESTYLTGMKNFLKYDGKLHTDMSTTFTATGRCGSRNPNLQNIPKRNKKIADIIRRLFVAPEGKVFLLRDYSQSELRWIAHRSQDPEFLRIYNNDEDIHRNTAIQLLMKRGITNPDEQEIIKVRKSIAKAVNFGFVYGMMPKGFMLYARDDYGLVLTLEESTEYREAFFNRYSQLPKWHEREIAVARKNGYCRSPFGRIRKTPNINSFNFSERTEDERQAINTPIQSASSDCGLLAAYECKRKRILDNDCKLVGFIHDELIFEVVEDKLEEKNIRIKETMENLPTKRFGFELNIPLKTDGKYGKNLADTKELPL
jgi:uracil-DNA glycosylase family 4